MRSSLVFIGLGLGFTSLTSAIILENGHARETNFPNTKIDPANYAFNTYAANASEISYKGRWDSKYVSYWTAPGIKFGFTGHTVAVTFGDYTIDTTLVGYRIGGMDWQFTNVTKGGTHLFVTADTKGVDQTYPFNPLTFEMRVSNWGYGVQIDQVHVADGEKIIKVADYSRSIEFIGDSLSSGMYGTYEGLSGFAYGVGAGLGDTEYSITAYPGICVTDQNCWGNPRGQSHQWFYTTDTSWRGIQVWGDDPEPWDFSKKPAADLVVINIGTNDQNAANNVDRADYVDAYKKLIQGIHGKWPDAQVIVMSLWLGFFQWGNSYAKNFDMDAEISAVVEYFNSHDYLARPVIYDGVTNKTTTLNSASKPFVHLFNTTGILAHNDIGPEWHPTDVGQIKVASQLIQYIKLTFGWELLANGPEIYHETLYWNSEPAY